MSLGAARPLALLAIVAPAIFLSVSADDYNEKWGDGSGGKGLDNRFIVGNWKQRNEEGKRKHLSDAPPDVEHPLAMFRRLTNLPNVSMTADNSTETGGRGGGEKMAKEQQRWGNSAGEGVDNRFWIGNLRRKNTDEDDDEPPNAVVSRSGGKQKLRLSFRRLRSSKDNSNSNVTASSDFRIGPIPMMCGNSTDYPRGCEVTHTRLAKETEGNFSCRCTVTTNPDVSNEECCHHACCNDIADIADRCARLCCIEIQVRLILDRDQFLALYLAWRSIFWLSPMQKILFPYTKDTFCGSLDTEPVSCICIADPNLMYRVQPWLNGQRMRTTSRPHSTVNSRRLATEFVK